MRKLADIAITCSFVWISLGAIFFWWSGDGMKDLRLLPNGNLAVSYHASASVITLLAGGFIAALVALIAAFRCSRN